VKILHLVHQFPDVLSGGTERQVAAIAAAQRTAGHEVRIACGSLELGPPQPVDAGLRHGAAVDELRRDDLYFESFEKAWSPGVGDAFRAVLARERPDVVHVHHWIRLSTDLARIAREAAVPVVACTLHDHWTVLADPARPFGMVEPEPPPAPRWMGAAERREAFAFHRDDLLDEVRSCHLRFVPSRAHAESLRALAVDELGPLEVAAPPLLERPPRRAPSDGIRGRRLLFWGSLYPAKGLELVLDAIASIGSGWELTVLGEAPDPAYGRALRERAARLPVRFGGAFQAADLAGVEADYAVVPATSHESYGLVVDEAQCLGLPLIAADLPAFREHVPAESCAFFEPNDPGSLAMLLLDAARLAGLRVPDPAGTTAAEAAARLLGAYEAARAGRFRPVEAAPRAPMRARAGQLFRRAERRLWTALQAGELRLPPDTFLGGS
jgi:glycosyltransferase involved in cell wall biosynthesis